MNVVLVFDIAGLKDKSVFDKHMKKEGFLPIEGEHFAYSGVAHTHLFNTIAYVLEVSSKAIQKSGFDECGIMFQIGENPMELYRFDKEKNDFIKIKV